MGSGKEIIARRGCRPRQPAGMGSGKEIIARRGCRPRQPAGMGSGKVIIARRGRRPRRPAGMGSGKVIVARRGRRPRRPARHERKRQKKSPATMGSKTEFAGDYFLLSFSRRAAKGVSPYVPLRTFSQPLLQRRSAGARSPPGGAITGSAAPGRRG